MTAEEKQHTKRCFIVVHCQMLIMKRSPRSACRWSFEGKASGTGRSAFFFFKWPRDSSHIVRENGRAQKTLQQQLADRAISTQTALIMHDYASDELQKNKAVSKIAKFYRAWNTESSGRGKKFPRFDIQITATRHWLTFPPSGKFSPSLLVNRFTFESCYQIIAEFSITSAALLLLLPPPPPPPPFWTDQHTFAY